MNRPRQPLISLCLYLSIPVVLVWDGFIRNGTFDPMIAGIAVGLVVLPPLWVVLRHPLDQNAATPVDRFMELVTDFYRSGFKVVVFWFWVALAIGVPLGLLYFLVRFVKWAWTD